MTSKTEDQRIWDIANVMMADEDFRASVEILALHLHHIGENTKAAERAAICEAIFADIVRRLTAGATAAGQSILPAQIEDFASAHMVAAFDLISRFPNTGAKQ